MYTDISKFTNLRELRVNYKYISKDIVERWTVDVTNLEHLTLDVVVYEEEPVHLITGTEWVNLTEACPKLKVDLSVHYSFECKTDIIRLLTPGMPLTGFILKSGIKRDENLKLSSILKHLADTFDKKLESFKLVLPLLRDSVDNTIVVVKKCRKLKAIRLPACVALGVAILLFNDFEERQLQKVPFSKMLYGANQDVMKTVMDLLSNIPKLKVEWVDDELRTELENPAN